MKKAIILCYLSFFLVFFELHAQQWHRIYFPNKSTITGSVFEAYDKGYILAGDFESPEGIPTNGMIIKTDINGEMLWSKTVSDANDFTSVCDINQTSDYGFILTGITGEQTEWLNPFIMKLDACGQHQWCRIFNLPDLNQEWGQSIWQIPGGIYCPFPGLWR